MGEVERGNAQGGVKPRWARGGSHRRVPKRNAKRLDIKKGEC